ncbi:hypothetical protein AMS68_000613 [Peltaster fructicola]|uniref:Urease accessory protein UreD n=1 Tax=Peltaster fructicola TaxID=286661 RepID=A0A6H0XK65_9PEZI|nr:hypothetical protein AMS68_000613 [Peltaster fructicola]
MPHKHTRKDGNDAASFNLAPGVIARPLSAFNKNKKSGKAPSQGEAGARKPKNRHVAGYGADDTPRAFARLMQMQTTKRPYSTLDDDARPPSKKRVKTDTTVSVQSSDRQADNESIKLLPGERLADFSARVNQAIPVAGLARRGKVKVDGVKERQTRKEKKMHKMYADWREEDARIKARQEELAEKAEEEEEDRLAEYGGDHKEALLTAKQTKRQRAIGEIGQMNDDPWAILKKKRQAPRGLHDVAQAPPDLKVIPREKFKVRDGAKVKVANVPSAAGSLKKREELSEARKEVIERYRAMMKANKQ